MLNPREQAIVIWFVIFVFYALSIKDVRSSIPGLIKSIFSLMRHPICIFTNVYILFVFLVMFLSKLLGTDLIKDYVVWIFSALFPMIYRVSTKYFEVNLKKIFIETFKFSVIPMFIINEYTLSLWAEIFIVPISALIGGLLVVVGTDEEKYRQVKKLLNYVLMIIGFVFIVYASKGFLTNVNDAAKIEFWQKMFIDFIGIILHIPLLFLIQIMSFYEHIILIKTNITNKLDKFRAVLIIFQSYNFNKQLLSRYLKNHNLRQINTISELKASLKVESKKS